VKGVLDLFLAQPFGGKSLFQRILMANMTNTSKEMHKDIDGLKLKINDTDLCKKIENAIQSEMPNNVTLKKSPISVTLELLKNPTIEPVLSPQKISNVEDVKEESQQLIMDLYKLWILYARKQEQEVMMALVFQGVTSEIVKDLFAMFYEPLAQVYKAANVGDSIGQVSGFIDDLISIIDNLDVEDVTNTVQPFIDLVQRHEQNFYKFVHNVHGQDKSKLFDQLVGYVDYILSIMSTGLPTPIDIQKITHDAGILPEEYPALIKEIDELCKYHFECKQTHLDRKRQKYMLSSSEQNEQDDIFSFISDDKESSVLTDMADIDSDSCDDLVSNRSIAHEVTIQPPILQIIPRIVPTFVEHVKLIL